ncbi:MAG: hypothetical protein Kow00109_06630 [Acidobacteriota bacterium]
MSISNRALRHLWLSLVFLFAAGFSTYLVFGPAGYLKLRQYRQQYETLAAQHEQLLQQQQELEERIRRLQEDPAEVERLAREKLELARPGDVVIRVPEPDIP